MATNQTNGTPSRAPAMVPLLTLCLLLAFGSLLSVLADPPPLKAGFYDSSCPQAEAIISQAVAAAIQNNSRVSAQLLRLHFHDCFVRGCDASVLLDKSDDQNAEKDADINNTLMAFEVVDAIKAKLEAACPGIVSCADLLAIAARDSVVQTGGPYIPMETGRRDGLVSLDGETVSLPVFTSFKFLFQSFADQGLSVIDMIALSGAHTLGIGHCVNVRTRIPPFKADGLLNANFRINMTNTCVKNRRFQPKNTLPLDSVSETTFDNGYFQSLAAGRGVFITDSILSWHVKTKQTVQKWAKNQNAFFQQFVISMLKMSRIQVLTGGQGEVRFKCRQTNEL